MMAGYSLLRQHEVQVAIEVFIAEFKKRKADLRFDQRTRPYGQSRAPPHVHVMKNDDIAKEYQEEVRDKSSLREKVMKFSQCLAFAETNEMKAQAYTRRAELLLEMSEEDLALLDTNRAYALQENAFRLSDGLTSRLDQIRLSARKKLMNRKDYRRIAVECGVDHSRCAGREAMKCSRKIRIPDDSQVDDVVYEDDAHSPHEMWSNVPIQIEQGLSYTKKVDLCYKINYGWHWRALEDISAGEALSVEDYFALRVIPSHAYCYCSYCTIWCLALIPCDGCGTAMYCSDRCRQEAFTSYHETECRVLPQLGNLMERQVALLALRIFLTGTKQGSDLIRLQPGTKQGSQPAVYDLKSDHKAYVGMFNRSKREKKELKNNYSTVLTLQWVTPIQDSPSFPGVSPPYYTMNDVIELFVALRKIGFINAEPDASDVFSTTFTDREKLVMVFLLHNVALLSFNHSDLNATCFKKRNIDPKTTVIGGGLPTCHSFLNHSCDPRAAILRHRRRELVYAVRNIKQGQEITISYGGVGDYGSRHHRDRKFDLGRKYMIRDCHCYACKNPERLWRCWNKESVKILNFYDAKRYSDDVEAEVEIYHYTIKQFVDNPHCVNEDNLRTVLFEFQKSECRQVLLQRRSHTVWLCEDLIKKWMQILRSNFRTMTRRYIEAALPPLLQ